MEGIGGNQTNSGAAKPSKFTVYQNAALSAALTSKSHRISAANFMFILSLFSASAFALVFSLLRENAAVTSFGLQYVSHDVARVCSKVILTTISFFLCVTFIAVIKAISQWRSRNATEVMFVSPSNGTKELTKLTNRQLGLLGLKPKIEAFSNKPPKSRTSPSSPSTTLVPLHHPISGLSPSSRMSGGHTLNTPPSKSPVSPSMYFVPTSSLRSPPLHTSPGNDQFISTPWSNKRRTFHKDIATEEELEKFLADVDEKISETASQITTPPPSLNGFGVSSPNTVASSVNTSGTTRSTPLRPVRMSPASKKFATPPKKGEGDLPPPMSMEESITAFKNLGIYPQIEQWRDRLRQWFSDVVINHLLAKIETSHLKVMESAAKLGISITISQIGIDATSTHNTDAYAVDEDGILHQLRATLVQALDACMPKLAATNFQNSPQHVDLIPVLQEGIDVITEYQRLHSLMKGEWGKGLLPQSSFPAHYTVKRIRELAEGTCVKNYEYFKSGDAYEKFPSDSHLLLYLFCAFLEYPNWMLHVDPTPYAGAQSSKNPLFLGVFPNKEKFPEKYIAVVSGAPSVLHPGACILAVGKQNPPVFALYWNKKAQFSLQGRTALWDSILLLCHEISTNYGGIVRGMHLGSSTLAILPVLDQEMEE